MAHGEVIVVYHRLCRNLATRGTGVPLIPTHSSRTCSDARRHKQAKRNEEAGYGTSEEYVCALGRLPLGPLGAVFGGGTTLSSKMTVVVSILWWIACLSLKASSPPGRW
ncbi:unnamed protein product [Boreogadus saida]